MDDSVDNENFLDAFHLLQDDEDSNLIVEKDEKQHENSSKEESAATYNSRKPRWWKQLSGKASKSQRRAMAAMQDYKLERPPFGKFIDWEQVFGTTDTRIGIEIGFGAGDNLLCLAQQYAGTNVRIVGAEIHQRGLGKVYQRIHQGTQRQQYWTGYSRYRPGMEPDSSSNIGDEHLLSLQKTAPDTDSWSETINNPYSNLRIYSGDGVNLFPYLPTSSVDFILVTFPDPFPKEHQKEWRLMQTHTVQEMCRAMKRNGHLYLATDHEGYNQWSRNVIERVNEEEPLLKRVEPCPDRQQWLPVVSYYERKGWAGGRQTWLTCWKAI